MKHVNYYRLWHQALQMSNRSNWSRKVENAFGDLSGLEFEDWWELAKPLFANDAEPEPLREISNSTDWRQYEEKWQPRKGGDTFVVMVDMTYSKRDLINEFKKMLDQQLKSEMGRPPFADWTSDWPLAGMPNVKAISTALDVIQCKRDNPSWKHWQIAQSLKINPSASQGKNLEDDTGNKQLLSAQVSRYVRQGNLLIRGVECGVFPNNQPID